MRACGVWLARWLVDSLTRWVASFECCVVVSLLVTEKTETETIKQLSNLWHTNSIRKPTPTTNKYFRKQNEIRIVIRVKTCAGVCVCVALVWKCIAYRLCCTRVHFAVHFTSKVLLQTCYCLCVYIHMYIFFVFKVSLFCLTGGVLQT